MYDQHPIRVIDSKSHNHIEHRIAFLRVIISVFLLLNLNTYNRTPNDLALSCGAQTRFNALPRRGWGAVSCSG